MKLYFIIDGPNQLLSVWEEGGGCRLSQLPLDKETHTRLILTAFGHTFEYRPKPPIRELYQIEEQCPDCASMLKLTEELKAAQEAEELQHLKDRQAILEAKLK